MEFQSLFLTFFSHLSDTFVTYFFTFPDINSASPFSMIPVVVTLHGTCSCFLKNALDFTEALFCDCLVPSASHHCLKHHDRTHPSISVSLSLSLSLSIPLYLSLSLYPSLSLSLSLSRYPSLPLHLSPLSFFLLAILFLSDLLPALPDIGQVVCYFPVCMLL